VTLSDLEGHFQLLNFLKSHTSENIAHDISQDLLTDEQEIILGYTFDYRDRAQRLLKVTDSYVYTLNK